MSTEYAETKVLAVDDDAGVCKMLQAMLSGHHDLDVRICNTPKDALELAKTFQPHVVLSDLAMPEMNGFKLTELLLAMDPMVQVVIVSGFLNSNEDIARGLNAGVMGYVDKPFSTQELLFNVRAAGKIRQRWQDQKEQADIMNRQILCSEKLASIGQLAAGVAHEINNPVGFVLSNIGTLAEYTEVLCRALNLYEKLDDAMRSDNSDDQELLKGEIAELKEEEDLAYVIEDLNVLLDESKDGCKRIRDIVQNLKSFARTDDGEPQEADINEGIESTLKIIWNELKYKCTVIKKLAPLPLLSCYIGQLNQVFLNLLVNAGHAIEDHGEITIETSTMDNEILITITDSGTGIKPEDLTKIFNSFFTTKEAGKGTGLGLAISQCIIQDHHGRIEVESEVGRGTTFSIYLPLAPTGADPQPHE